jgi:hypothetical protein
MATTAKNMINKEKQWLMSQIGEYFVVIFRTSRIDDVDEGLIADCDDDVMDEVSFRVPSSNHN